MQFFPWFFCTCYKEIQYILYFLHTVQATEKIRKYCNKSTLSTVYSTVYDQCSYFCWVSCLVFKFKLLCCQRRQFKIQKNGGGGGGGGVIINFVRKCHHKNICLYTSHNNSWPGSFFEKMKKRHFWNNKQRHLLNWSIIVSNKKYAMCYAKCSQLFKNYKKYKSTTKSNKQ